MKVLNVNSQWFQDTDLRLDAQYYVSDVIVSKILFKKSPLKILPLSKVVNDIFKGNIFRRTYVNDIKYGYLFMTASDMSKSNLDTQKYISVKYTPQSELLRLKKDWILVSRSGTLGITAYTNKEFENIIGTDDLIRVIPNDTKIKPGFLFAYLSSKYGYSFLTQSSYGGVVKHIEPHHIEGVPVPIFSSTKQIKVDDLIKEANSLRVEANKSLRKAVSLIEAVLPDILLENIYVINVNDFALDKNRINAQAHLKSVSSYYHELENIHDIKTIGQLSSKVFTPNIFKRIRVHNPSQGIPFLSGSDLMDARPAFKNYLSKKMKNIDDYILRSGWIAIQDAGTIGYVSLINGYLDGAAATNNLVRIIPNKLNYNPYIYAFLCSKIGQKLIKSLQYGSVQKHIDDNQIRNLRIPIIEAEFKAITKLVNKYLDNNTKACKAEQDAISIVEKEIASWEK